MQFFVKLLGVILMFSLFGFGAKAADQPAGAAYQYSFRVLNKDAPLPLADYRGKVILVVNVASQCGFTKQYAALEKLYETFRDQGLVIIGVPSNDFGGQEPGTADQIAHFCQLNFGVTFPMADKEVVSGDDAHPFYLWARQQLGALAAPKWNFHKYLIARDGRLVDWFSTVTAPDAPKLVQAVERELKR